MLNGKTLANFSFNLCYYKKMHIVLPNESIIPTLRIFNLYLLFQIFIWKIISLKLSDFEYIYETFLHKLI